MIEAILQRMIEDAEREKEKSLKTSEKITTLESLEILSCFIREEKEFVKLTNNLIMDEQGEKIIVEKNILCKFRGKNYLHGMDRTIESPKKKKRVSTKRDKMMEVMRRLLMEEKTNFVPEKKYEKKSRMPQFSDLGIKVKERQKIIVSLKTSYRTFNQSSKPMLPQGNYRCCYAVAQNGILCGITILYKGFQYPVAKQDVEIIEIVDEIIPTEFIREFE